MENPNKFHDRLLHKSDEKRSPQQPTKEVHHPSHQPLDNANQKKRPASDDQQSDIKKLRTAPPKEKTMTDWVNSCIKKTKNLNKFYDDYGIFDEKEAINYIKNKLEELCGPEKAERKWQKYEAEQQELQQQSTKNTPQENISSNLSNAFPRLSQTSAEQRRRNVSQEPRYYDNDSELTELSEYETSSSEDTDTENNKALQTIRIKSAATDARKRWGKAIEDGKNAQEGSEAKIRADKAQEKLENLNKAKSINDQAKAIDYKALKKDDKNAN